MYPSDIPQGYVETWRKIISVYPPVDTMTMASALGNSGYPGGMPMLPTTREVRVNTEKNRIEIWERKVESVERAQASGVAPTFTQMGPA